MQMQSSANATKGENMSLDLSSVSADLSFLRDSIVHRRVAGPYAEADVRSFNANTPGLQEAVRYWSMPIEYSPENSMIESNLLNNYKAEIEIVRRYLWETAMARMLMAKRDEPPSLLSRTIIAVNEILPSTANGRRALGVVSIIVGIASAFFLLITIHNPLFCVVFGAVTVISLTAGIYLIFSARSVLT